MATRGEQMGFARLVNDDYIYDPVDDVWTDTSGRKYIKNEFHPHIPIWIDVTTNQWTVDYSGNELSVDWDSYTIPSGMFTPIHAVIKEKLKKLSVSYMNKSSNMLIQFQSTLKKTWNDFSDIPADEMVSIYEALNPSYRSIFRELYKDLACRQLGGARLDLAYEMRSWKARNKVVLLREVREWNPYTPCICWSCKRYHSGNFGTRLARILPGIHRRDRVRDRPSDRKSWTGNGKHLL